ncbi:g2470 [Coccomyxa elongata]
MVVLLLVTGTRIEASNGGNNGGGGMDNFTKALIAGAFIMGMGTGVWFNSEATFYPSNVASTEVIDRRTPNSEVCMANGYSSMVFDERVFVSFNPFNVYVTQPEVKPGCVLRRANIGLLEKKKLVTDKEVGACTKNMNTFGFVGDLNGSPEVSCVYHSEDGENQFLKDPKRSVMGDGFQPHELLDTTKKVQVPAQN